jgi:hypothetical protein
MLKSYKNYYIVELENSTDKKCISENDLKILLIKGIKFTSIKKVTSADEVVECNKLQNITLKSATCIHTRSLIHQRLSLLTHNYINPLDTDIFYNIYDIYNTLRLFRIDSYIQKHLNMALQLDEYKFYLKFYYTGLLNSGHVYIVILTSNKNEINDIYVVDSEHKYTKDNVWLLKTIQYYFTIKNDGTYFDNPLTIKPDIEIKSLQDKYPKLNLQILDSKLVDTGYCTAWSSYFIYRNSIKREDIEKIIDDLNSLTPESHLLLISTWWNSVENYLNFRVFQIYI